MLSINLDRSISTQSIKEARSLRSRRYRNRRLDDFLNGLNLSEGWATGIPTIQNELEKNGSPYATIETDEGRTFFLIDIPCHPEFLKEEELVSTLSQPVSTLYQAWMQAMDEVQKNSSTDAPERVLTLCINLVSTSITTFVGGYWLLEKVGFLWIDFGAIDYIAGINFNEGAVRKIKAEK